MTFAEFSHSLYEDLNGSITTLQEGDVHAVYSVRIECDDWNAPEDNPRRIFQLRFFGVREVRCDTGFCGAISKEEVHPLLWDYTEPNESVYFSSIPDNPEAVLGRIYETHERLFRGWRTLDAYWNASTQILRSGNGLLFRGPRPVADAYCAALKGMLDYSRVATYTPGGICFCYILEDNFVIASDVEVVELSGVLTSPEVTSEQE